MKSIFGYRCTKHFLSRITERKIPEYLISLCLCKGIKTKTNRQQTKFTLVLKELQEAVRENRINPDRLPGLYAVSIIIDEQRLITAYPRYSDVGI